MHSRPGLRIVLSMNVLNLFFHDLWVYLRTAFAFVQNSRWGRGLVLKGVMAFQRLSLLQTRKIILQTIVCALKKVSAVSSVHKRYSAPSRYGLYPSEQNLLIYHAELYCVFLIVEYELFLNFILNNCFLTINVKFRSKSLQRFLFILDNKIVLKSFLNFD